MDSMGAMARKDKYAYLTGHPAGDTSPGQPLSRCPLANRVGEQLPARHERGAQHGGLHCLGERCVVGGDVVREKMRTEI